MDTTDIVLYTNHCPLCDFLKEQLDSKGIAYTVFDDVAEMARMGLNRMPVLSIEQGKFLSYKQALQWLRERN